MQWKEKTLYSLKVPVAEMLKWLDRAPRAHWIDDLDHFVSLAIGYELRCLTTCNSVTQTYPMVVDLPHLWILIVERQSACSLDFKPEMGLFCGLRLLLMAAAFE
jgi:hypothetical protein